VAFHLHRLKLFGRALHQAGYDRNAAADLAAARMPVAAQLVAELALRLGITHKELTRPLSGEEARQWAFYRASAANPQHVWDAARAAWRTAGLTDREAATVMGYGPSVPSRARALPTKIALSFVAAARLTTALRIPEGPEAFLPPLLERDSDERSVD
jgi:hypothetical protein